MVVPWYLGIYIIYHTCSKQRKHKPSYHLVSNNVLPVYGTFRKVVGIQHLIAFIVNLVEHSQDIRKKKLMYQFPICYHPKVPIPCDPQLHNLNLDVPTHPTNHGVVLSMLLLMSAMVWE